MKLRHLSAAALLGACFALSQTSVAFADEARFEELKKNLKVDASPVDAPEGLVTSYAPALEKVMPAVVTITATKSVERGGARQRQQEELFRRMFPDVPEDFFERHGGGPEREQQGLGSGVVISSDGYIVTNNHVVADADNIQVTLPITKKEYEAELVGSDPRTDLALIKIDAEDLSAITFGDSSNLRIGDVALAVGNPLGLEQTATVGIISAVGRSELNITQGGFEDFIQTDAAINRGNSGGALVDAAGRLIGINTAIQSNFSGGNIGIGFAIPSNMALNIVERLLDGGGTVARGFLGVYLRELDANFAKALGREDREGVLVTEVNPGTPAEEAGMKPGDLIVGYNGAPVSDVQRLRLDISNTAPGASVTFDIIRNGRERQVDAVLGDLEEGVGSLAGAPRRPSPEAAPKELVEGVRITALDEATREALDLDEGFSGVVVESVKDNSSAADAGLRPGMVVTQIDQTDVASPEEAYGIVENFEGDVLLLQVFVGGRRDILAVPLND